MKLRYSANSPFVRKVMVVAAELGLADRIQTVPTDTSDPKSGLSADNPLGKVPALITDDKEVGTLYDSAVICEYLDSLHDGPKLHPSDGIARWHALRRETLADGIMDAAVLRRMESQRPANERSAAWDAKQRSKVMAGLDVLEREAARFVEPLAIDQIAVACALGYLDFRFAAEPWRDGHPTLARWYDRFAKRPSMATTVPPG